MTPVKETNVNERDKKSVLRRRRKVSTRLKAMASAPQQNRPGKGRVVEKCGGGFASVNEVLKKFESARRERNEAAGIKRSGVTISLDDRNEGWTSMRTEPQRAVTQG